MFIVVLIAGFAVVSPSLTGDMLRFAGDSFVHILHWLVLAIVTAAYAKASSADRVIARAFAGQPSRMIPLAAVVGAVSPFCSCGVVPIIAALLSMGVPLSAVIAFCLASPIMDPAMFALTAGVLGVDFAIAKTVAAVLMGLLGGTGVYLLERRGLLTAPLRAEAGNGGCQAANVRQVRPVMWRFWTEAERRHTFWTGMRANTLLLGKWLLLAYLAESLMLRYVPAERIAAVLGPESPFAVPLSVLVGIPAYLNGYAALPLVGGLVEMGTSQAAAMGFLVGGAVTSIPAAMAVGGITRLPVFLTYLTFAIGGALAVSGLYALWLGF